MSVPSPTGPRPPLSQRQNSPESGIDSPSSQSRQLPPSINPSANPRTRLRLPRAVVPGWSAYAKISGLMADTFSRIASSSAAATMKSVVTSTLIKAVESTPGRTILRSKLAEALEKKAISSSLVTECENNLRELTALTGDERFGLFLRQVSEKLFPLISSKKEASVIFGILSDQEEMTTHLILHFFTKVMLNIGKELKSKEPDQPIKATNIIAYFLNRVVSEINVVDLSASAKIKDPQKKKEAEAKAVDPAIEKLLRIALPNGANDLPVNIFNDAIWTEVKEQLAPFFVSLAASAKSYHQLPGVEKLNANPQNELLAKLTTVMGAEVKQWGKDFATNPQLTGLLSDKACSLLSCDTWQRQALHPWIQAQMLEIGNTASSAIEAFWQLCGNGTEKALVHLVTNINSKAAPTDEATGALIQTLMKTIGKFRTKHQVEIDATKKKLIDEGKIPEEDPTYQALFLPLVKTLQNLTNLKSAEAILPDFMVDLFNDKPQVNHKPQAAQVEGQPVLKLETLDTKVENFLSKILAEQYTSHLVPLSDLYESIINPKEPNGRRVLADFSTQTAQQAQQAGEIVTAALPTLLEANAAMLAAKISTKTLEKVEGLENKAFSATIEKLADSEAIAQAETLPAPPSRAPLKAWLETWLAKTLTRVQNSKDPRIQNVWKFLGNAVENMFAHTLLPSFIGPNPADKTDDASTVLFHTLMTEVSGFAQANDALIKATHKEISENEDPQANNPLTSKKYHDLFIPLAQQIQQLTGLQSKTGVIPEFLVQFVDDAFVDDLPELIAKYYLTVLSPSAELYQMMESNKPAELRHGLEKTPEGKKQVKQCELLAPIVIAKVKEGLVEKQAGEEGFAASITKKLAEEAKDAETNIGIALLKALSSPPKKHAEDQLDFNPTEVSALIQAKSTQLLQGNDPRVEKLWQFFGVRLENIFEYVTIASSSPEHKKNALQGLIDNFANILNTFIAENDDKLAVAYAKEPDKEKLSADFIKNFDPLATAISKYIKTLPLPDIAHTLIQNYFKTEVPALIASQYREFLSPQTTIVSYRQRLKKIFKEEKLAATSLTFQIENMCSFIISRIVTSGGRVANEELTKFLNFPKSSAALSPTISFPATATYPELYNSVKAVLMHVVVTYLETAQKEGVELEGKGALTNVLTKLADTLQTELTKAGTEINKAVLVRKPAKRVEKLKKALLPLSIELMKLFELKDNSLPVVKLKEVLPSVLADLCLDTTSTYVKSAKLTTEIVERAKAADIPRTQMPKLCGVLGQWITKMAPSMVVLENEDISETTFKAVQKYLKETGNPEGISINDYLTQNEGAIKAQLCQLFVTSLKKDAKGNDTTAVDFIKPPAKIYVETMILEACHTLTKRIDESENPKSSTHDLAQYQPDFLINLGTRMLTLVIDHFETLSSATTKAKNTSISDVRSAAVIETFRERNKLHPRLPVFPEAIKAQRIAKAAVVTLKEQRKLLRSLENPIKIEKCQQEIVKARAVLKAQKKIIHEQKKAYFDPLAATMLELVGIKSAKDIPVPSGIQEEIYDAIKNQQLPAILNSVFDLILEPNTMNTMVITGLETFNEVIAAEDKTKEQFKAVSDKIKITKQNLKACLYNIESSQNVDPILQSTFNAAVNSKALGELQDFLDPNAYRQLIKDLRGCKLKDIKEKKEEILGYLATVNNHVNAIMALDGLKIAYADKATQEKMDRINKLVTEIRDPLDKAQTILEEIFAELIEETTTSEQMSPAQKDLNGKCGDLIQRLFKVSGSFVGASLFRVDKIKDKAGDVLGRAIYKQLSKKWTMLKLLEKGAESGIATFLKATENPESDDALEQLEMDKLDAAEKNEYKAKRLFAQTAQKTVSDAFLARFSNFFEWIWDATINKLLYRFPEARPFLEKLGSYLIQPFKWVTWLFGYIAEQVLQRYGAGQALSILYNDMHENLLAQLTDEFCATVKGERADWTPQGAKGP